ncbi:hypothetical protein DRQ33_05445 [bacterium]|nr:MAG: hypothetical protein DRQ33_05445 [bacterium]
MQYLGEILSLSSAIIWALAVILFKKSGEKVHPIALNLFKSALAFILYIPTMLIFGEPIFRQVSGNEYILFVASGIIGVGIADTLFFLALNKLGASMNAVIGCVYSPLIILFSTIFIGERMSLVQIIGAIIVVSAVLLVGGSKSRLNIGKQDFWIGLTLGILSMVCMAIGIVMIKPALEHTPILWAIQTRLAGGIFFLLVFISIYPHRARVIKSLLSGNNWKYTLSGSFLGNYVALITWIGGMKYTLASVSSALNQTTNLFVFVFAGIFLAEKLDTRKSISIAIGLIGAFLVTFG